MLNEPIGTLSSAFFLVAAGIIAYYSCGYDLLVLGLICLGGFSGVFHADGSKHRTAAHRGDEGAMYFVGLALVYYSWNEYVGILVLISLALTAALLLLDKLNSFYVIGGLAVLIIAGMFDTVHPLWILMVFFTALTSFGIRSIDEQTDIIHGIWHLAISGTILLTWWALAGLAHP